MAMIKILQYPTEQLERKGKHVDDFGPATQKVIDDMFETHYGTDNCAALAATQLDFDDPLHITVIDFSSKKDEPLCIVNGEVIEHEGVQESEEGCMSVPGGTYEKVKRAEKIKVKAQDRNGKPFELEADGFMAKCIQHELDHLNGKIFLDHLSAFKRKRVDGKIDKYWKFIQKHGKL